MNAIPNEIPYELQEIEMKFARMVPDSDSSRDDEVLRVFMASQPTIASSVSHDLAQAKRQGFLLGGMFGLCFGAIAMFLTLVMFMNQIMEPTDTAVLTEVATPIPPTTGLVESFSHLEGLTMVTSTDAIRHLVPPPSAFWVPFSIAVLLAVFVMLFIRHLQVRFVF